MKLIKKTTLALSACLFIASNAMAGEVTLPNTFTANTTAVADEVNANFTEVKTAVDDNNARITTLEGDISALPTTHVLSFPAGALAGSMQVGSTVCTWDNNGGINWTQSYNGSARVVIKKPDNYSGGDVTLKIFFYAGSNATGVVDFFIRAGSFDDGDNPSSGLSSTDTGNKNVSQGYHTEIETITEDKLQKEWWVISMQRKGTASTYTDPVVLKSIALEYQ